MNLLLNLNHALLLASLVCYGVLGLSFFWLLGSYLFHRRAALAREAKLLAAPLPADLPHVLVQLPTFNEGALIKRLAARVGELQWPREKLHVQILDDSTDGSQVHAQDAAQRLRQAGMDAMVLHRLDRGGFKAGALLEGLKHSDAEYVAILDADYLPPENFLTACIRPFLADERLGLVQARCDFLNGGENLITATQQRLLDAHYAIEQPARNWSGQIMPFNGTCGMWRRAALDSAGNWQGDTIAEDMDVSYRAQTQGWRALFLVSVAVPGELPASFRSWRKQQFRWTHGSAQVMRKVLPAVWRSPIALGRKIGSTFHLGLSAFGPLSAIILATTLIEYVFAGGLSPAAKTLLIFAIGEMLIGPTLMQWAGQIFMRRAHVMTELIQMPVVVGLQLFSGALNLAEQAKGLFGPATAFVRTPKQGSPEDALDVR